MEYYDDAHKGVGQTSVRVHGACATLGMWTWVWHDDDVYEGAGFMRVRCLHNAGKGGTCRWWHDGDVDKVGAVQMTRIAHMMAQHVV